MSARLYDIEQRTSLMEYGAARKSDIGREAGLGGIPHLAVLLAGEARAGFVGSHIGFS